MSKVLKPYGNACTVELDLPWEVAELLVEQGPSLIKEIAGALKMRRQRTDYNEQFATLREEDYQKNKEEFHHLGKLVTELQHKEGENSRKAVRDLATEMDTTVIFLEIVALQYRDRIKKEEKRVRDTQIIRLYFQGHSNKEIAKRVGASAGTVANTLSKEKDLIGALRLITQEETFLKGGAK